MSVIPPEIPDLGSSQLSPRQNPTFSPGPGFTTEDYFVWSRLDGRASIREIILMVGLGVEKSIAILRKLRRSGAMLLPGEERTAPAGGAGGEAAPGCEPGNRPALPRAPASQAADPAPAGLIELGDLTPEEARILGEAVALQDGEKRRIIQVMRLVAGSDYFALLGVSRSADKRELKRAYFRLSKEFHPDRHYKQDLGTFGPLLNIIFENATLAFQELSDDGRRAAHIAALAAGNSDPRQTGLPGSRTTGPGVLPAGRVTLQDAAPLSPEGSGPIATSRTTNQGGKGSPRGSELFARACDREVAGDLAGAIRLFRAAIQLDPQPRYLRRAAKCALEFGQLKEAQAYAEKAFAMRSDDASYARLMSDVARAAGRLDEAEAILLRALELPSTSDAMVRELQSDLAAVRRGRAHTNPNTVKGPPDE